MKHIKLTTALALAAMVTILPATADIVTKKDTDPDNWNRSIKLKPMSSKQDTNVPVSAFGKENQLRCWQHGDLIVLENDWTPVDAGKGRLMSRGPKQLHAYDYGETFCIYSGG